MIDSRYNFTTSLLSGGSNANLNLFVFVVVYFYQRLLSAAGLATMQDINLFLLIWLMFDAVPFQYFER